jgi:small conductance mechanosensitive channel
MFELGKDEGWEDLRHKLRGEAVSLGGRLIVALLIVIAGLTLARVLSRMAGRALARHPNGLTLAPLARSAVRFTLLIITLVMALDQIGVPIATVLAGAGIVGLAVGFGAQALVKDIITGFFHIMQGVISVGDVVQVGDISGVVEDVDLRLTKVRSFNGELWYLPNGSFDRVGNFNRGWCRAVVDVNIALDHDVTKALKLLQELGEHYREEHPDLVLERPEAQGIMALSGTEFGLRLVIKVRAQEQWTVERDLRRRIKETFAREGVEIPIPKQAVYSRS